LGIRSGSRKRKTATGPSDGAPAAGATTPDRRKEVIGMAAHSVTGLEPNDPTDPGEAASNEPDTGPDVQQEGDFQGNY
jgi:hypothetical protein